MYTNQRPGDGGGSPAIVAVTTFLLATLFVIISAAMGSWMVSTPANPESSEAEIPVTGGEAGANAADSLQPDLQSGTGGSSEFSAYAVLPGDTLGIIAARSGTTLDQILQHNPQIQDPSRVRAGDTLYLPSNITLSAAGGPAQLTISPASGPPGTPVAVYGRGFTDGSLHDLSIGVTGNPPVIRQPLNADLSGVVAAQVIIPAVAMPGEVWFLQASSGPDGSTPSAEFHVTAPGPETITLQPGDILPEIAARHGIAARDLFIANPGILDPRGTVPGVVLTIPQPVPPEQPVIPDTGQPRPVTYTVQPGDTLGGIARQFGTTVDQLTALNPQIQDPDRIFPGWVLTLP